MSSIFSAAGTLKPEVYISKTKVYKLMNIFGHEVRFVNFQFIIEHFTQYLMYLIQYYFNLTQYE